MNLDRSKPRTRRKRGVVAVLFRQQRLLVIRRSLTVTAPGKLCLPGGGIEEGETEAEALVREMEEELAMQVTPVELCFRSVTPWGTNLAWWYAQADEGQAPEPNPDEVAEFHWMTRDQVRQANDALPSLPPFLTAWEQGEIGLQCSWA